MSGSRDTSRIQTNLRNVRMHGGRRVFKIHLVSPSN